MKKTAEKAWEAAKAADVAWAEARVKKLNKQKAT
jgi:hypothetical protein